MILSALTDYNLGYSLPETAARLKKKTNRSVSAVDDHDMVATSTNSTAPIGDLRADGLRRFPPSKPSAPSSSTTDKCTPTRITDRSSNSSATERSTTSGSGDKRFAALADFLESVPTTCPHDLFRRDDDPKARASQAHPAFADVSRIIVNRKENAATQTAALIIPAVGNNKLRHETLQRFMLANDSVTVAVEIPIWLTETDIAALEVEHGIELAPRQGDEPRVITGHIDFLQVRNGAVHILDYKPDARTNKPIAQLAIYALALTRLVRGLKLFDIKCAWFNEQEYCEIFPRTLFAR